MFHHGVIKPVMERPVIRVNAIRRNIVVFRKMRDIENLRLNSCRYANVV